MKEVMSQWLTICVRQVFILLQWWLTIFEFFLFNLRIIIVEQRRQWNESVIQLVQLVQVNIIKIAQIIIFSKLISSFVADSFGGSHELNWAIIQEKWLIIISACLRFFKLILNAAKMLGALRL